MYDIRIENGLVINGTGSPALAAQVAIRDGKIVKIARQISGEAKRVIDAAGQVITPGFIDSHSHSDRQFFTCPLQTEKIEQGITTSIAGQCGGSLCGEDAPAFFDQNQNTALGANMALLIGHGTLRKAVVGTENREATPEELEQMKTLLRRAMEHGALGISFGLIYAPGCFAKTEELIALARVVGEYQGIAAIHLRDEGDELLPAVQEFITIVRESGVRGIFSHHKSYQKCNWGKVRTSLEMIEQANQEGLELFLDAYPYTASHTTFSSPILPKEWRSGGKEALIKRVNDPALVEQVRKDFYKKYDDLSWILITACPEAPEYNGLTVSQVAQLRGQDEFSAALDVIRISNDGAKACFFSMCEEDVEQVLAHPRTMVCTDSGVAAGNTSYHPRLRASFPRALARYVREKNIVSLPEMIRKMTSMPAAVYGLKTKGLVWEGMDADLCIFDPATIEDRATYAQPTQYCKGLSYVIVGGKIAVVDGVATGELGGTLLLRDL